MTINNISYPHPVLGNGDDFIIGDFVGYVDLSIGEKEFVVFPSFELSNIFLEHLVESGQACFKLEIQGTSTFFRQSFECKEQGERIILNPRDLRGNIEFRFYICAKTEISNYEPKGTHSDYGKSSFSISKGDILAICPSIFYNLEMDFDPLKPTARSLMQIGKDDKLIGPSCIEYENEKIIILLSKNDWEKYSPLIKGNADLLHGVIVFPVLIDALHKWKNESSEYREFGWFGKIEAIVNKNGMSGDDPYQIAQKILENPIERALNGMDRLITANDNNNE